MSTFTKTFEKMKNGSVGYRSSWGQSRRVFFVSGSDFTTSFFKKYDAGRKLNGDQKGPHNTVIQDVVCFVDLDKVTFGWQPTQEDLDATDWCAKRK
jgi:hypothetical protein